MEEDIKKIQNTVWAMYKDVTNHYNASIFTSDAKNLCAKYKDDPPMLAFCQRLIMAYTPIINGMCCEKRGIACP